MKLTSKVSALPALVLCSLDLSEASDAKRLEVAGALPKPFTISELSRAVEYAFAEPFEAEGGTADFTPRRYWGLNE
jgi:hypothetical protein